MSEQKRQRLAPWAVAGVAALVAWLLWVFGAEATLFQQGFTATLLGISVAVNVGLVAYLLTSRPRT